MVQIEKLHMNLGNLENAFTIIAIYIEEPVINLKNTSRYELQGS